MRPEGLPIDGFRGHPVIEDCDIYRSAGESSALLYLCDSGHTHYLAPDDFALLQQLARAEQPPGQPPSQPSDDDDSPLSDLHRMGLIREGVHPGAGRDVDVDAPAG